MAVIVSVADFRARFPEFNTTLDQIVQDALDEAFLIHSIRKLATLYCAAHLLAVPGIGSGGSGGGSTGQVTIHGEVSSKKVGPLSVSYTTLTESSASSRSSSANNRNPVEIAFFSRTEYGRHFLILELRSPRAGIGAMVAG